MKKEIKKKHKSSKRQKNKKKQGLRFCIGLNKRKLRGDSVFFSDLQAVEEVGGRR